MPAAEVNLSTLTPHELSKMNKKDLIKHFGDLQVMFEDRGRKYGTSHTLWSIYTTHPPVRQGEVYHSQK
jgi:hypothetical protein